MRRERPGGREHHAPATPQAQNRRSRGFQESPNMPRGGRRRSRHGQGGDSDEAVAMVQQEMSNLKALKRLSIGQLQSTLDPDLPATFAYDQTSEKVPVSPPRERHSPPADGTQGPEELLWVPAHVHPEIAPNEWKSFVKNKVAELKTTTREREGRSSLHGGTSRLSREIADSTHFEDGSDMLERKRKSSSSDHSSKRQSILELSEQFRQLGDFASLAGVPTSPALEEGHLPSPERGGADLRRSSASSRRRGRPALRKRTDSTESISTNAEEPVPSIPVTTRRRSSSQSSSTGQRNATPHVEPGPDSRQSPTGPTNETRTMRSHSESCGPQAVSPESNDLESTSVPATTIPPGPHEPNVEPLRIRHGPDAQAPTEQTVPPTEQLLRQSSFPQHQQRHSRDLQRHTSGPHTQHSGTVVPHVPPKENLGSRSRAQQTHYGAQKVPSNPGAGVKREKVLGNNPPQEAPLPRVPSAKEVVSIDKAMQKQDGPPTSSSINEASFSVNRIESQSDGSLAPAGYPEKGIDVPPRQNGKTKVLPGEPRQDSDSRSQTQPLDRAIRNPHAHGGRQQRPVSREDAPLPVVPLAGQRRKKEPPAPIAIDKIPHGLDPGSGKENLVPQVSPKDPASVEQRSQERAQLEAVKSEKEEKSLWRWLQPKDKDKDKDKEKDRDKEREKEATSPTAKAFGNFFKKKKKDSDTRSVSDKEPARLTEPTVEPAGVSKAPGPAHHRRSHSRIIPSQSPDHPIGDVSEPESHKHSIASTGKPRSSSKSVQPRHNPQPHGKIQLPYDIPAHQLSDRSLVMMHHRFPLHIERAIYRLSHMKLANPHRPLRQQVLLSNFMYAYLNLINQGYQHQMGGGSSPGAYRDARNGGMSDDACGEMSEEDGAGYDYSDQYEYEGESDSDYYLNELDETAYGGIERHEMLDTDEDQYGDANYDQNEFEFYQGSSSSSSSGSETEDMWEADKQ